MTFSRIIDKQKSLERKIRRAMTMAKLKNNPDFNVKHNQETIDANKATPDYTKLIARVTKDFNDAVTLTMARRSKYVQ